jgi:hypothetical protein
MNTKKVMFIIGGLALVLSIVFVTNFYNQTNSTLTGRVVQGQECSIAEKSVCEDQNTFICINGEWQNAGHIAGKCDDNGGGIDDDCTDDADCLDGKICKKGNCVTGSRGSSSIWIIITILIILILAVIGFIIYMIIKKDNKKRNKTPPGKMFKRKPNHPARRPLIKQANMKPMKKTPLKPLAKPLTKPSNVRPLNSPKPPTKKSTSPQRYNPPKR